MARPQREYWIEASREKCNSILWNDMFAAKATSMPTGNRPIRSKWVFKTQTNLDRSIWHKAQLVIKGYMQPDWGESHGPDGKLTTFRYLTSLATGYGLAIDLLDVVTAFLNSHVDDSGLYTETPNGWDNGITAGAIGLKQAPRLWYKT